ncbi:DNA polymerase delta subunit 4 [Bufo bufo]|uniref:DNA polymerase delta subunit 4 n=1 Tax=Bufo bufo TaxID=8384 RepID=UPI001ABE6999|nr:DNA polymerase delta subunit 4 [Bufo bufo]
MERKHKLTDYLPVTRHGNKREGLIKGNQEERDTRESSVKKKGRPVRRRAGDTEQDTDAVAVLPELSLLDKLIQFDLDWRFGPCTGITRLERWQRADELGLVPPKHIRDILLAHNTDAQYQLNLWSSYAI